MLKCYSVRISYLIALSALTYLYKCKSCAYYRDAPKFVSPSNSDSRLRRSGTNRTVIERVIIWSSIHSKGSGSGLLPITTSILVRQVCDLRSPESEFEGETSLGATR
ncbi:hypothetical protein L873DRAFT_597104 [Choiromyces venosus 120613-1]|uniref:Uncharacterized protein n=1 Tax=Choiromyces venosus 120613-1 TaxID=1336337 RepID=A0A3N4JTP0_9PEZI|nr:hypothetical protein L873DRAFT_597104 [Choiromyces venosus 120613-1]